MTAQEIQKIVAENTNEYQIVDVRGSFDFAQGHIKGSINLPLENWMQAGVIEQMDQSKKVILVCTKGIKSVNGKAYLNEKGFKDVLTLDKGLENSTFLFSNSSKSTMND